MATYKTTDTALTSIADAIRTKGGTSSSLTYPTGFVSAIENLPSGAEAIAIVDTLDSHGGTIRDINGVSLAGDTVTASHLEYGYTAHDAQGNAITGSLSPSGGSSYTLLASQEYEVNTSSTSAVSLNAIILPSGSLNTNKIIYVSVRDKAGPRNGYFYCFDAYYLFPGFSTGNSARLITTVTSEGGYFQISNLYGVYSSDLSNANGEETVTMYARYHSVFSGTINGTFKVDVYSLDYANSSPFLQS